MSGRYYVRDPASEVVMLEETVANSEIQNALSLIQSINQSKKIVNQSNQKQAAKIDLDYVRRCLNELNSQNPNQVVPRSNQLAGPGEELAYALQSLSNSTPNKKQSINQTINQSINHKKNQHDRSLVVSFDANDTANQSFNVPRATEETGDIIISEDEVPKSSNQPISQSLKQQSLNQANYDKLQSLENRLAFVNKCLQEVQSNIQSISQARNQPSAGPDDDQAYNILQDKKLINQSNNQSNRIRSKL